MKYREHRGSLADSMETVIEVKSLRDLATKMNYKGVLSCKEYSQDHRIGWDTWLICEDGFPIGMSNGELKADDESVSEDADK
jgi:hypothetical protein